MFTPSSFDYLALGISALFIWHIREDGRGKILVKSGAIAPPSPIIEHKWTVFELREAHHIQGLEPYFNKEKSGLINPLF